MAAAPAQDTSPAPRSLAVARLVRANSRRPPTPGRRASRFRRCETAAATRWLSVSMHGAGADGLVGLFPKPTTMESHRAAQSTAVSNGVSNRPEIAGG
jgi:hypothetical protein